LQQFQMQLYGEWSIVIGKHIKGSKLLQNYTFLPNKRIYQILKLIK